MTNTVVYNYYDKLVVYRDHVIGPDNDTRYGIVLDITEYKNNGIIIRMDNNGIKYLHYSKKSDILFYGHYTYAVYFNGDFCKFRTDNQYHRGYFHDTWKYLMKPVRTLADFVDVLNNNCIYYDPRKVDDGTVIYRKGLYPKPKILSNNRSLSDVDIVIIDQ